MAAALARAGGPTRAAEVAAVNLAAPVEDGQQVVVPRRGAGAAPGPAAGGAPGAAAAGGQAQPRLRHGRPARRARRHRPDPRRADHRVPRRERRLPLGRAAARGGGDRREALRGAEGGGAAVTPGPRGRAPVAARARWPRSPPASRWPARRRSAVAVAGAAGAAGLAAIGAPRAAAAVPGAACSAASRSATRGSTPSTLPGSGSCRASAWRAGRTCSRRPGAARSARAPRSGSSRRDGRRARGSPPGCRPTRPCRAGARGRGGAGPHGHRPPPAAPQPVGLRRPRLPPAPGHRGRAERLRRCGSPAAGGAASRALIDAARARAERALASGLPPPEAALVARDGARPGRAHRPGRPSTTSATPGWATCSRSAART